MGQKHPTSDRSFILIGQACDGKSTLGNLMVGGSEQVPFPTHAEREAAGLTREPTGNFAELNRKAIFEEDEKESPLRIHVVDQPGLSDPNFSLQDHTKNMITCIKHSYIEMSETFLIVINLNADYIPQSAFEDILQLEDLMAKSSYKFFGNATIVFTHADLLLESEEFEGKCLEEILKEKLKDSRWEYLKILLERVENRCIFINGKDMSENNRKRILRDLFFLTKPVLRIIFHGNNHFTCAEMQKKLRGANGNFSITEDKYRLECNFSPDIDLFNNTSNTFLGLEEGLVEASRKLRHVSQGISVMVILISLTEPFILDMENFINKIPTSYQLSEEFNNDFWKYSLVIFKIGLVQDKQSAIEFIKRNVANNPSLNRILAQANGRYTWVETNLQVPPFARIIEQCLEIKKSCEGRDFINRSVIHELNQLRKELKPPAPDVPNHERLRKQAGAQYNPEINKILTRTLVLNNGFLSGRLVRFYMKTMNPNISEALVRKMFPNEDEKVSNEEFIRRLIEKNMKDGANIREKTQEELLDSMK